MSHTASRGRGRDSPAAEDAALPAEKEARRKIREQKSAERKERVREKIESL